MNTFSRWWAAGLVALTLGCSKSEPAGGSAAAVPAAGGAAAAAPAAKPAEVAADVYMQGLIDGVTAGDAGKLWSALPAKYQADVTSIKNEFASKVDADVWNKAFVVVGKLGQVLKDKKTFLMAGAASQFVPPDAKEPIDKNWDSVVGMLNTLASSELKTADGLKSADVGKFLNSTGSAIFAAGIKTAEAANPDAAAEIAKARKSKVILVKQDGDTAILKLEADGETKPEKEFKRVDGKWLPADMVADWDQGVADVKADMSAVAIPPEQKEMVMGLLAQVETVLDKLLAAKDQTAFDAELGVGMMTLGPVMGALGGGGGAMSGPPGAMSGPPGGLPGAAPGGLPGGLPPTTPDAVVPPTITPPTVNPPKTP